MSLIYQSMPLSYHSVSRTCAKLQLLFPYSNAHTKICKLRGSKHTVHKLYLLVHTAYRLVSQGISVKKFTTLYKKGQLSNFSAFNRGDFVIKEYRYKLLVTLTKWFHDYLLGFQKEKKNKWIVKLKVRGAESSKGRGRIIQN